MSTLLWLIAAAAGAGVVAYLLTRKPPQQKPPVSHGEEWVEQTQLLGAIITSMTDDEISWHWGLLNILTSTQWRDKALDQLTQPDIEIIVVDLRDLGEATGTPTNVETVTAAIQRVTAAKQRLAATKRPR